MTRWRFMGQDGALLFVVLVVTPNALMSIHGGRRGITAAGETRLQERNTECISIKTNTAYFVFIHTT